MKASRCCIVGGGGYFGQHIARAMQTDGFHTVLLDIAFTHVDREGFSLDETKTTRIKGSLMDEPCLENALHNCSLCIHLAAYGMAGASALNSDMTYRVNFFGTLKVLEICSRMHCRNVVFASSVAVCFTDKPLQMATEDAPRPDFHYSAYADSKADAEAVVCKANSSELRTVALRFRGIFGPGEPRTTEKAAMAIARGFYFVRFEKSSPAMTQFSGVDNSAMAVLLASRALKEKPELVGGRVYTIVDGGPPVGSWDFWNPLIDALGRRRPFFSVPYSLVINSIAILEFIYTAFKIVAPPMNQLEVNLVAVTNTFSIERARKDLGYEPTNNHDLSQVCEYYKEKFTRERQPFYDFPHYFKVAASLLALLLSLLLFYVFY